MGPGLKILAIADLHDRWEHLLSVKGFAAEVDLIAVCGDLHDGGSIEETRVSARALADLGIPAIVVPGNTDPREHAEVVWKEMGFSILHRTSCIIDEFGFIGMGGIVPRDPKRIGDKRRYYFSDEDVYQSLARCHEDISRLERRIVLAHQPPRGVVDTLYNGQDSGGQGLKKFIEDFSPDLLICGHIHEARGESSLGKTRVVNAGEMRQGNCAVIELGQNIEVSWKSV